MSGIIVADAGPLHYLILIDCAEILPGMFGRVFIPGAVRDELFRESKPQKIKTWISLPRPWLEVQLATDVRPIHGLHAGEVEALNLALKIRAEGVLMDDLDGRSQGGAVTWFECHRHDRTH